jgi:hypothetical protein
MYKDVIQSIIHLNCLGGSLGRIAWEDLSVSFVTIIDVLSIRNDKRFHSTRNV